MGLAVYLDRTPGDYTWRVDYPVAYPPATIVNATGEIKPLSGNQIAERTSSVMPVGQLRVRVREQTSTGPGNLVPAPDVLQVRGPDEVPNVNEHLFTEVPVGDYRVSATVVAERWTPAQVSSPLTRVEENAEAVVELLVAQRAWVKVKVHDIDQNLDLTEVTVTLTLPDQTRTSANTTNASRTAEARFRRSGGTVDVNELIQPAALAYELVDLTIA